MRKWRKRSLVTLLPIILILLLAAYVRWKNPGRPGLSTDQSTHSTLALRIAREGEFSLQGPPMSVGMEHSPFAIYVYALPYAIVVDPRVVRLFAGSLDLITVSLIYVIGTRYFSRRAGLLAALLFAVQHEALAATSNIWNPMLGAPFVMAYLLTGLLGYIDNKRLPRLLHVAMLAFAVQTHPTAIFLAPLSIILWVHAFRQESAQRGQLMLDAWLSNLLALLVLTPWLINLLAMRGAGGDAALNFIPNRGLGYVVESMLFMIGGWQPNFIRIMQPVLTLFAASWLIWRGLRRREALPGLIIALSLVMVPLGEWIIDMPYRHYHSWSQLGGAFLILGALLGGVDGLEVKNKLLSWKGWRWVGALIAASILVNNLLYFVIKQRNIAEPTLDHWIEATDIAGERAAQADLPLLTLATTEEDHRQWAVIQAVADYQLGHEMRVVWSGQGLPVPPDGAILFGMSDYAFYPDVFSGGDELEGDFRLVEWLGLSSADLNIQPATPLEFSNNATFYGFSTLDIDLPQPGETWVLHSLWHFSSPPEGELKTFVHLVDAEGNKYAQLDLLALPAENWRPGENVLHRWELPVSEALPAEGVLYLQVGQYTETEGEEILALDAAGNPVGSSASLQIRGVGEPLAALTPAITLDALDYPAELEQGPPPAVTATWFITDIPEDDYQIELRLLDPDDDVIFSDSYEFISGTAAVELARGAFVTQQYYMHIPTDIAPARYTLELQLVDLTGEPIGDAYQTPLRITERVRQYEIPEMLVTEEFRFDDEIALLGYDFSLDGRTLFLTMHWQAFSRIETDYNFYVHVSQNGEIVAQFDGMPLNYAYPTSWWAAGEIISNPVGFDLSAVQPGLYELSTGFYNPQTGERLPAFQGERLLTEDTIYLRQFEIQ